MENKGELVVRIGRVIDDDSNSDQWIRMKHHALCFIAFFGRSACLALAVVALLGIPTCDVANKCDIYGQGHEGVQVDANTGDLMKWTRFIAVFQIVSMGDGVLWLLGTQICVPEEKLTRRQLQCLSIEIIVGNLVFGGMLVALVYALEGNKFVVMTDKSFFFGVASVSLALTPLLYYCPSEEYRAYVARTFYD